MADIHGTHSGEFMVTEFEGMTEAGTAFIDAWVEEAMVVADAGRIVLQHDQGFITAARHAGLTLRLKSN